jgi:hypothetical protein
MMNWEAKMASGVPMSSVNGVTSLVVSTGPGKLLSIFGLTDNGNATYVQVFDATAVPSTGAWTTPPILQLFVSDQAIPLGTLMPTILDFPIPCENGCVLVLSSSGSQYTADTNPIFLGAQFVPDLNAVPPGTQN